jgi:hypothetical protein
MTEADNGGMQDWVADYDGEGQERAARDGGDSRVAMIAAVAEDGGCRQQRQRLTMTVVDDNIMQYWAMDYDGEGKEWFGKRWRRQQSGNYCGRWRRRRTKAKADDDCGGR